jgi:hypothetical protein
MFRQLLGLTRPGRDRENAQVLPLTAKGGRVLAEQLWYYFDPPAIWPTIRPNTHFGLVANTQILYALRGIQL